MASPKEETTMRGRIAPKIQRTIRVPKALFDEVERLIKSCGRSESMNDFVVKSMKMRVNALKRRELDAKFSEMSKDTDYQKAAQLMAEEFESSDWEAIRVLEG
jgi:hypothetical protein